MLASGLLSEAVSPRRLANRRESSQVPACLQLGRDEVKDLDRALIEAVFEVVFRRRSILGLGREKWMGDYGSAQDATSPFDFPHLCTM